MNSVNRLMSILFDVLLTPFELLGTETGLILLSGLFGIVCLIIFKFISWQGGIKSVKDKIKGNMIAIRIYQDDLVVVFQSVVSVVLRNFQYLALNFGPILPLLAPFALVLAQFVVRYGYDPLDVVTEQQAAAMMSGEGTSIEIKLKRGFEGDASQMTVELPDGLRSITPVVRSASEGEIYLEVAAVKSFSGEIQVRLGDAIIATKAVVAGDERTRRMQPVRVSNFWESWLYPAEDAFAADCPVESISFAYPARQLNIPLMPPGEAGILLIFLIASMLFGVAVLKPLNITI